MKRMRTRLFVFGFLLLPASAFAQSDTASGYAYNYDEVDQKPVVNTTAIYKCIDLSFLDSACMRHSSRLVVLTVLVEADGKVSKKKIVKSSGDIEFDRAVIKALYCAECFTPARKNGERVACWATFPVSLRRE